MGSNRVLVGAPGKAAGVPEAGAAYLFSADGALRTTFTNPAPTIPTLGFAVNWSTSVATVGGDRFVLGAPYANNGAFEAGATFVFNPPFQIATVAWPASDQGWWLERTNVLPLSDSAACPAVSAPYQTNGEAIFVSFTNNAATGNAYFRLHKQ